MKKHAIIPIFIPHKGCPHDCVFCNQRAITARTADVTPEDVRRIAEQYLSTLEGRGLDETEISFFGGSFTGIPLEEQSAFLAVAKELKDAGRVDKIHLSTRPDYIDETIKKWKLSKTNESGYKAFRSYYNRTRNPLDLYVLMCFSFNYQFRFNSQHEYNNPFGKNRSSFNEVMRNNLILFKKQLDRISFSALDFFDFDYDILDTGDFIYADPPYRLTCGSYNDGKRGFRGWTDRDDEELLRILSELSDRGVLFAFSNVIEHKGSTNDAIIEWAAQNGYIIHGINFNYDNCNYHTNNRDHVTREVLITNY